MRLSLFSDYSVRVLLFGAVKGGPFPLHEVAEAYNISRHHLVKVVNHLTKKGYLSTRRGRGGGIELAMKPEEIQIGCLVRATEKSNLMDECINTKTKDCPIQNCYGLKGAVHEAAGAFYEKLDHYTLNDMMLGQRDALRAILLKIKPVMPREIPREGFHMLTTAALP